MSMFFRLTVDSTGLIARDVFTGETIDCYDDVNSLLSHLCSHVDGSVSVEIEGKWVKATPSGKIIPISEPALISREKTREEKESKPSFFARHRKKHPLAAFITSNAPPTTSASSDTHEGETREEKQEQDFLARFQVERDHLLGELERVRVENADLVAARREEEKFRRALEKDLAASASRIEQAEQALADANVAASHTHAKWMEAQEQAQAQKDHDAAELEQLRSSVASLSLGVQQQEDHARALAEEKRQADVLIGQLREALDELEADKSRDQELVAQLRTKLHTKETEHAAYTTQVERDIQAAQKEKNRLENELSQARDHKDFLAEQARVTQLAHAQEIHELTVQLNQERDIQARARREVDAAHNAGVSADQDEAPTDVLPTIEQAVAAPQSDRPSSRTRLTIGVFFIAGLFGVGTALGLWLHNQSESRQEVKPLLLDQSSTLEANVGGASSDLQSNSPSTQAPESAPSQETVPQPQDTPEGLPHTREAEQAPVTSPLVRPTPPPVRSVQPSSPVTQASPAAPPVPAVSGHVVNVSASASSTQSSVSFSATVTVSGPATVTVSAVIEGRTVSLGTKQVEGSATFTGSIQGLSPGTHSWVVSSDGLSATGTVTTY